MSKSPLPLRIAALVVGLQSLILLGLSFEVFFDVSKENLRASTGVGVMLLVLGVGLGLAALGLLRSRNLARGPVMVAQLISLGLAWNLFRTDEDLPGVELVGALIAAAAVIVLALMLTPSAREALADRPEGLRV